MSIRGSVPLLLKGRAYAPVLILIGVGGERRCSSTGGGTLTGAAVDPSGQFLYAVVKNDASSAFNSAVFEFTIDPVHGMLTLQLTTFPAGYGASAVAITGSAQ